MRDLLCRVARGEGALGAACIAGVLACGLILIAALTLENAQVDRRSEAAEIRTLVASGRELGRVIASADSQPAALQAWNRFTDLDGAAAGVACIVEQVDHDLLQPADVAGHSGQVLGQPGRCVAHAAERDGRPFLCIAVQDRGHGIAPDLLPQLFVSFVTTKLRGTGLGLRICRRIIEEMGGSVAAANRAEGGACFEILLPAARLAGQPQVEAA